jgi:hypothetical protein
MLVHIPLREGLGCDRVTMDVEDNDSPHEGPKIFYLTDSIKRIAGVTIQTENPTFP